MKPIPKNVKTMDEVRRALAAIELAMRTAPLNNLAATSDPGITDDRDAGYSVGSFIKNTTSGEVFINTRDAPGNALWISQPITDHNLLDGSVHVDTAADAVTRGSLIIGNSTPEWDETVVGSNGQYLGTDGTDAAWQGLDIVDDTSPTLGGDLAMGGFDLSVGDSNFNIEFNSASTKTLSIVNDGFGAMVLVIENVVISDQLIVGTSFLVGTTSLLKGNVTIGDNSATDFTLKFNASANDGTITWDEDPGQFLFDHAIDVTGNIIIENGFGLVVGHTAKIDFGATPELQVLGTETSDSSMGFARFENTTGGPDVRFLKSRGATIGANTIVQDGDTLGRFRFQGADGGDFNTTAAQISAEVDGTPSLDDIPGRLIFTTRTAGGSLSEKMRLDNAGNLTISGTVDGRDVAADGTAQDSHIANSANPHGTDIENLGAGTLAELNAAISDATLDDASDSRTPSAHTVASHSDTTATGSELNTLTGGTDAGALHLHEGTAIKSTGEAGGSKFLREDGDGTCSWQAAAGGGGDLVDDLTPQAGGDIDMNTFDIQFDDATGIRDDSDNEQLIFQKTASAVTYFEMTNATTGNGPTLAVTGETNVDFNLLAKGTGIFNLGVAGDIDVFAGTAFRFGPAQNKKAHLGSASLKWDTGSFGGLLDCEETGIRTAYDASSLSTPTDAELDTAFGQPAALGEGFIGIAEDTSGGSRYICITDGTSWFRTGALTAV